MILDLFAGPGGWDVGLWLLGIDNVLGLELDGYTCDTRRAAGLRTVQCDVSQRTTADFVGITGLIASPPCTAFSQAGNRHGIRDIPLIYRGLLDLSQGIDSRAQLTEQAYDKTSMLVLEVLRWATDTQPVWIACEQVKEVLPLWDKIAEYLRLFGYNTWVGLVDAADYGVPQNRQRAILMAHRYKSVCRPEPTHAEYPQEWEYKWMSMAQALGWGFNETPAKAMCGNRTPRWMYEDPEGTHGRVYVGFKRKYDGRARSTPDGYRERDMREINKPAFSLTEKARSWEFMFGDVVQKNGTVRKSSQPAPTITASADNGNFQFLFTGTNSHTITGENDVPWRDRCTPYKRTTDRPAPTLDKKAGHSWRVVGVNTGRSWKKGGARDDAQVVPGDRPAPSLTAAKGGASIWDMVVEENPWVAERPATTISGDYRVQPPGHKRNADDVAAGREYEGRAGTNAIKLGPEDAGVLQSFPIDYPWQGSRTAMFAQIGNAIPPLLAAHILYPLVTTRERLRIRRVET